MDLKQYFRKIQAVEATITEDFPIVISLETSDGGKGGRVSEVSRSIAAVMIVEGRAVLATAEEKQAYYDAQAAARKAYAAAEAARRVQVAIVSESELSQIPVRKLSSK